MTDEQHRAAVVRVVGEVMDALALSPQTAYFTRLMPCYDLSGQPTGVNHAELSTGDELANGSITNSLIDALPDSLGVTFVQDSRADGAAEHYRLVRFSGVRDDITVYVSIRLDTDGSATLVAETRCR